MSPSRPHPTYWSSLQCLLLAQLWEAPQAVSWHASSAILASHHYLPKQSACLPSHPSCAHLPYYFCQVLCGTRNQSLYSLHSRVTSRKQIVKEFDALSRSEYSVQCSLVGFTLTDSVSGMTCICGLQIGHTEVIYAFPRFKIISWPKLGEFRMQGAILYITELPRR